MTETEKWKDNDACDVDDDVCKEDVEVCEVKRMFVKNFLDNGDVSIGNEDVCEYEDDFCCR